MLTTGTVTGAIADDENPYWIIGMGGMSVDLAIHIAPAVYEEQCIAAIQTATSIEQLKKIKEVMQIMLDTGTDAIRRRVHLARRWLFRDTELDRKQLIWSD